MYMKFTMGTPEAWRPRQCLSIAHRRTSTGGLHGARFSVTLSFLLLSQLYLYLQLVNRVILC
jgi:hypothetical protein